jgi:hypothetical protein
VSETIAVGAGVDVGEGAVLTGGIGITGGAIVSEGGEFTEPDAGAAPPDLAESEALIFQVLGVGN